MTNEKAASGQKEELRPRFKTCERIQCPLRFKCDEKLEVDFTDGGYCIDYRCKKVNRVVYWE